ncbi:MAG: tRNA (N(6)-L-threonylcarbamoyladenosine(37)-C(2))-methylthiotransferase MtaB [Puniceicoccaceae bacterium]|nr:MAG: tRNA (N(6)-L-threonylcarbamoyladenosine(37)-C(2))-methylthiotransferase MtaB [Puniceicoccaceae bacterium]
MVSNLATRRRASIHTLGCRLNQAESLLLRDRLEAEGYEVVPFGEPADLGIINTCTVTRLAEAKARQVIRGFIRRNPRAFTAVIGCYSQMGARELAGIPGVDLIVGNQDKLAVLDHVRLGKLERPLILRDRIDRSDFSISFVGEKPCNQRANLKIQDGCDFMCSFCIIPMARGRARSREWENLLAEARSLVERGVRELVLTGVNLGTYASGGKNLADLVDAIDAIPGLRRVRISSIEPTTVPDGLLDRMADPAHRLQPFLHLPLQSGSDRILAAMRRKYCLDEYMDYARAAVARVPGLHLGTDLLTGFPGETEEDFGATYRVLREGPFASAHCFTYSEREGTPAVRMADTIPKSERNRRGALLRRLAADKKHAFHRAHLGREMGVLCENRDGELWPSYTSNYIRVVVPAAAAPGRDLANRIATVRLERVCADFTEGTLITPP